MPIEDCDLDLSSFETEMKVRRPDQRERRSDPAQRSEQRNARSTPPRHVRVA